MEKVIFLKNAAILTATSLLLRFAGVIMKVWLAKAIGSEGIGLYQLIFSFYALAATFATSGICTAVTRLIADELGVGAKSSIKKIMRAGLWSTVLLAMVSNGIVFFFSEFIARHIIGDARATESLKILSFSLVFMGISSCIKGYFIARRKTLPQSFSQIFEQAVRIVSIMFLVKHFAMLGIEYACFGVFLSDLIAEAASCIFLAFAYRADNFYVSRLRGRDRPDYSITRQIARIAAPISGGRYANSVLRTFENSLVPTCLVAFGAERSAALADFGRIKGMALPLLFFPSSLLGAMATLLIPEVSEARSRGRKGELARLTERIISITAVFGIIFGFIFAFAGRELGELVYGDKKAGELIMLLSPIVPLMYLDSIADGMLKGMDKQAFTFVAGVSDSAMRIVLIAIFIRRFGLPGFIGIMYVSNIYTCSLNLRKLLACSGAELSLVRTAILPTACAAAVTVTAKFALGLLTPASALASAPLPFVIIFASVCLAAYFGALILTKCISKEEIKELVR